LFPKENIVLGGLVDLKIVGSEKHDPHLGTGNMVGGQEEGLVIGCLVGNGRQCLVELYK
jgi:hypothetical protein